MTNRLTGTTTLACALLIAWMLVPAPVRVSADAPAAGTAPQELHEVMGKLGGSFRDLRRSVRSAESSAETLTLLGGMQQAALHAKALLPQKAASLSGAQLDQFKMAYRVKIISLLEKLLAAERAVLEDHHEAAKDRVKEINTLMRDAHGEFQVKDE